MHPVFKPLIAAGLLAAVTAAYAVTATEAVQNRPENPFYRSNAQGWYWYVEPTEEEMPPAPEPEPAPAEPAPVQASADTPPPPEPFSLQWVQTMLPRYRETAWNDPTPENVEAYFLVQRFAIDRSTQFANVAEKVVTTNPILSPETAASHTVTVEERRQAAERTDRLLSKVAEKAGLYFFFRSDCRYCEIEAPLIGALEKLGFQVLAVSLDGGSLQSHVFENTRPDKGQANALGVKSTPTLIMMTEDGQFTPVADSMLPYNELRSRVLAAALKKGLITEAELAETKPKTSNTGGRDLGKELPLLMKAAEQNPALLYGSEDQSNKVAEMPPEAVQRLADADNYIPPAKIISLLGVKAPSADPKVSGEHSDENQ